MQFFINHVAHSHRVDKAHLVVLTWPRTMNANVQPKILTRDTVHINSKARVYVVNTRSEVDKHVHVPVLFRVDQWYADAFGHPVVCSLPCTHWNKGFDNPFGMLDLHKCLSSLLTRMKVV